MGAYDWPDPSHVTSSAGAVIGFVNRTVKQSKRLPLGTEMASQAKKTNSSSDARMENTSY